MFRLVKLFSLLALVASSFSYANSVEPTLIGGTPADPAKWPFVVWLRMNGGLCTATVVGKNAVITAAHCVRTGEKARFKANGKDYVATFTRHPLYPNNDWDVALGITKETIDVDPASIAGEVSEGDLVHLMGYGCTRPGGTGGNDGILREGDSKVIQIATYDIILRSKVALCFGDSGGPAFLVKDDKVSQVGVNSKGDISTTSYETKLFAPQVVNFIKSWSAKNSAPVCGVTANCGEVTPPPPEEEGNEKFSLSNNTLKLDAEVLVKDASPAYINFMKEILKDTINYLQDSKKYY